MVALVPPSLFIKMKRRRTPLSPHGKRRASELVTPLTLSGPRPLSLSSSPSLSLSLSPPPSLIAPTLPNIDTVMMGFTFAHALATIQLHHVLTVVAIGVSWYDVIIYLEKVEQPLIEMWCAYLKLQGFKDIRYVKRSYPVRHVILMHSL